MQQIMLLQSAFSIMVVLLEVPSGYFADVLGRKRSLVLGTALGFVGLALYSCSHGFWGFLVAESVLGLGASFISGADSALLYDTLLALDCAPEYKKLQGRYEATGNFSEGVGSIVGGLLAVASLRLPFLVQTAVTIPAMLIALTLREPPVHAEGRRKASMRDILDVVKFTLHSHKELKWLVVYSSVVSASTLTMTWFTQPYFTHVGLPLSLFGVAWAGLQFSVGFFSLAAHRIEEAAGRRATLVSLVFLAALGYALVSQVNAVWGIGLILIFYFVRGMVVPVLSDYVNQLTPSPMRATVLSINALLFRLIFATVGPVAGWVADSASLDTALVACGCVYLGAGVVALVFVARSGGMAMRP